MLKLQQGIIPRSRAYYLSTEMMLGQAKRSAAKEFIVATEIGMIYRLRKELPEKTFIPVSTKATCRYMKANSLEKLLVSLDKDRVEIVLCDDCCDPEKPKFDGQTLHIQRSVATKAKTAIDRMLAIGA
jgi:quinolinate synthase